MFLLELRKSRPLHRLVQPRMSSSLRLMKTATTGSTTSDWSAIHLPGERGELTKCFGALRWPKREKEWATKDMLKWHHNFICLAFLVTSQKRPNKISQPHNCASAPLMHHALMHHLRICATSPLMRALHPSKKFPEFLVRAPVVKTKVLPFQTRQLLNILSYKDRISQRQGVRCPWSLGLPTINRQARAVAIPPK